MLDYNCEEQFEQHAKYGMKKATAKHGKFKARL